MQYYSINVHCIENNMPNVPGMAVLYTKHIFAFYGINLSQEGLRSTKNYN